MPLSTSDPYYRAEVTPSSIDAIGDALCSAYGVGADHFGCKGNTSHVSGYHRSRRWILKSPDSVHGTSDYSIQLSTDLGGDWNDCSAFDFTPASWGSTDNRAKMRVLTARLIDACKAHDPRVAHLREVAGTLDGSTVVTWDCSRNAFKTPFDRSHLDHVHSSIYRSYAGANHSGIIAVMLGQASSTKESDMFVRSAASGGVFIGGGRALTGAEWNTVPADRKVIDATCATDGAVRELFAAPIDVAALAAALAPLLGDDIDEATVVAALQSPAGQAALTGAANVAEDS